METDVKRFRVEERDSDKSRIMIEVDGDDKHFDAEVRGEEGSKTGLTTVEIGEVEIFKDDPDDPNFRSSLDYGLGFHGQCEGFENGKKIAIAILKILVPEAF